jgi:hypothetical protein
MKRLTYVIGGLGLALSGAVACGPSAATRGSSLTGTCGGAACGDQDDGGIPTTGIGGGGPLDASFELDGGDLPHPSYGQTVTQAVPPPPLSGGTLVVSADGTKAWASDPDRDVLHVIDLATGTSADVALAPGAEPGRLVVDDAGRVHVALRRGGSVASIDPVAMTILSRTAVCAAPRGITYDATSENIYVVCASGELVTLPAAGGAPTRIVTLEPDLRDVVLVGGSLYVSTLRTADVMQISAAGTIAAHLPQPPLNGAPSVAWRLTTAPNGGLGAVMQSATQTAISTAPGGYGGPGCGGAVTNPAFAQWTLGATVTVSAIELPAAAMPIDIAWGASGNPAVIFAGEWKMPGSPQLMIPSNLVGVAPLSKRAAQTPAIPPPPLEFDGGTSTFDAGAPCMGGEPIAVAGQATSVAFDAQGKLYVQTREPATLIVDILGANTTITLSTTSCDDTGHDIFHSDQGGGIACASCHAEGGEDGRTWVFDGLGPRRTPTVLGTVSGTAPYHWMGEEKDLPTLYTGALARMSGVPLLSDQVAAESAWIQALAEPPQLPGDATSIANGEALFTSAGCDSCHSGPQYTNNLNEDVGTGGAFQVPPLKGVGWRPPYLHDGCATSLTTALDATCAVTGHGNALTLTTAQLGDLAAYLTSL